ncbi:MAG: DnaJ domain-containing protein [Desulfobacterales bacterium]|jgi:DnaJ-class molecular chaperone
MRKNPYKILGIGRFADQKEIKSAYRRAAKKSHPDLTTPKQAGGRFCEIQEAYETLKDEQRRRRCDEVLDRMAAAAQSGVRRLKRTSGSPLSSAGRPVEPLIPADGRRRGHPAGASRVALEIVLTPSEAQTGGRFPVRLAMETDCPGCGNAVPGVVFCDNCGGMGRVQQPLTVFLDLPAGIRDGDRTSAVVDIQGHSAGVLDLLFRIDPRASWAPR